MNIITIFCFLIHLVPKQDDLLLKRKKRHFKQLSGKAGCNVHGLLPGWQQLFKNVQVLIINRALDA
jgi:hypothetical protein